MSRTEKGADMLKVSPFLIKRCIDNAVGPVQECKKLRSGILLIKCTKNQSEKLISMKNLNKEINIKCEKHDSFNTSKGKVYCRDLCYLSDEEILSELADQNVTHIRRMKRRNKETNMLTEEDVGIYILTFKTCSIPESIRIGYNNIHVQEFIPDPFRCYKCFRFGHSAEKCREDTKKCPNCSEDAHCQKTDNGSFEKCNKSSKCVNCSKNHNSFYRNCDIFKKEKTIQFIRIKNRISYFEARRRYKIEHPLPISFAKMVKPDSESTENVKKADTQPSTSGKSEICQMETEEIVLENTKKCISKDGNEFFLAHKNTPKHKLDKIKAEQKKKAKYEGKPNTSHDESSE